MRETRSPRRISRLNVKYELKMLDFGIDKKLDHLEKKKKKKERDKSDDYIGSIYNDSILLHIRNLYKFFKSKNGAKAKDYLNNKWEPTRFKIINEELITEINTYRSHISKSRKMGKGKPIWERKISQMRDEIAAVYEEFREQLSSKELQNWPKWEILTNI